MENINTKLNNLILILETIEKVLNLKNTNVSVQSQFTLHLIPNKKTLKYFQLKEKN